MLHGPLDSLYITRVSKRQREREDAPAGCRICTFPMISASVVTLLASCSNSSGLHSTPPLSALFLCLRRAFIWQNVLLGHLLDNCCCCSEAGRMCSMCVKILFDYGTGREIGEELAEIFIANIYFLQQDVQKRQQRAFTLMHKQFK